MSIWTSKALLAASALFLACCVPSGSLFQKTRSAPVLGGAVTIGVPAGYCIDRSAGREGDDTAVIIMGRCADNLRELPAVITVSVGRSGTAGAMIGGGQALADFFTSPVGRGTLARSGRPADVKVITAVTVGDAFLMHLNDAQGGEYWRAVLGLSGRLITVSASGSPDLPLSAEDSRKVLDLTTDALRSAAAG